MMNKINKSGNIFLKPVNILRGSKELLENMLKELCDLGYFTNTYNDVISHFAFQYVLLTENIPVTPIEWGNMTLKIDAVLFCDSFKETKTVKQTLKSIWNHFHLKDKSIVGAYQNHCYEGFKGTSEPYMGIRDTRLQIIARKYFKTLKNTPL